MIPTIWDRGFAWGMVDERKPDPDMPKSKAAKNRGNTLWAHLADIRIAWARTSLDVREREALLLCGGMGLTYAQAGRLLGAHKSTIQRRYETGVGLLVDQLNGTTHTQDW